MIRLKDILLERSSREKYSPENYTGDNGNELKLNLSTVDGVILDSEAAKNYEKMIIDMNADKIKPIRVSGFRSYEDQYNIVNWDTLAKKNIWRTKHLVNGIPAKVAPPGRSNHGWGKAIDVKGKQAQKWIKEFGVKYGWAWYTKDGGEGQSINEPWHFTYKPNLVGSDIKNKSIESGITDIDSSIDSIAILKYGDSGKDVKSMQERLLYLDYSVGPMMNDSRFGPFTEDGLKEFQSNNTLPSTGIYDDDTKSKLESLTNDITPNEMSDKIQQIKTMSSE